MNPEQIAKKVALDLLKKQGVVMVGLGNKITGGKDTGKLAIVVGVKKKQPLSALAAKDIVPAQIRGMDTDVVETGEIKLL